MSTQAQLLSEPNSPAACYRPMQFKIQGRGITSLYAVAEVRIADAADVTALANGLVVGDVLVEHAGVPVDVGDVVYVEGCGSYDGLRTVAKVIVETGSPQYLVIGAPDHGDVTPITGRITAWPDSYSVHCELLIYTDTQSPPTKVRLRQSANQNGVATFDVGKVISNYFNKDISAFVLPIAGGGVVQDAHGVTAVFYRVRFTESWQADPIIDPWDGTHEIEADATDDIATYRIAVNAVHPYHSDLLTWETVGLGGFQVGGSDFERKFLTHAPRTITLADTDHFRAFIINSDALDYEVVFKLRIFDMSSGSPVFLDTVDFAIAQETAAFAVGIGPADLAGSITVPSRYRVYVSNVGEVALSEYFEISVDAACKEVRRPMAALNSLGGIDLYTFTGREFQTETARRATVRKPYGDGAGYDYTERTYRNEPVSKYLLSSAALTRTMRKWVAETFMRSANVVLKLSDTQASAVIIQTDSAEAYLSRERIKPVTIEYRLGAGNIAQMA